MKISFVTVPVGPSKSLRLIVRPDTARAYRHFRKHMALYEAAKFLTLFEIVYNRGRKDAVDESTYRRGRGMRDDARTGTAARAAERHLKLPKGSISIHLHNGSRAPKGIPIGDLREDWDDEISNAAQKGKGGKGMNAWKSVVVWLIVVCTTTLAQSPVIVSITGNGEVSWTNAIVSNAVYRVEWGPTLDGKWYQSFQAQRIVEGQGKATFTSSVPMFYRVVMATNLPPDGMVLIDSGTFQMGDNYGEGGTNERPVHPVYVSGFYMDRYEVSKRLWDNVRNWAVTNGYTDLPVSVASASNLPAGHLSWYDCVKWCNARSQKESLVPAYYTSPAFVSIYKVGQTNIPTECVKWDAGGYRLPTEAEWEKAARGSLRGHHFPWPSSSGSWSNHIDGTKANYANSGDPFSSATPIGYFNGCQDITNGLGQPLEGKDMANQFGLYDMAGNVFEWCWDKYQNDWYNQSEATNDNTKGSTTGDGRILRSSSFNWSAANCRCSSRPLSMLPYYAFDDDGLRCVRKY